MVQVYYGWRSREDNQIVVTEKNFYDKTEEIAEQPNGENEVVYQNEDDDCDDEDYKEEPYNYYAEINHAFWDIGCMEDAEAVYNLCDLTLDEAIEKMREKGFELIPNDEFGED